MLTLSLVRTPDRHRQLATSGPELKPFVRSEERRVGKSVDLGGRRIIKKKNKKKRKKK